jgi:hypothetical protein
MLQEEELELHQLKAEREVQQLSPAAIRERLLATLQDISKLLNMDPAIAKQRLARNVQKVMMMPVNTGAKSYYKAEGEFTLPSSEQTHMDGCGGWI